MDEEPSKNPDPISGQPGAHPLGTGVGAAGGAVAGAAIGAAISGAVGGVVGAVVGGIAGAYGGKGVAEAMNPTKEDAYWRKHHAAQPYADTSYSYEHYAPAYRIGYEAARKHAGKKYEEIEDDLALDYERNRAGSALSWDQARHATRAAWTKVSGTVTPRDTDRGIRSGM